jgi:hypothetical protein
VLPGKHLELRPRNIQHPESSIQDHVLFPKTFIKAPYCKKKICNLRVKIAKGYGAWLIQLKKIMLRKAAPRQTPMIRLPL